MSVTVTKFGDPFQGSDNGVDLSILKTCINVTREAKTLAPVDLGQLRNSIMYKTSEKEGGFNESGGEQAPRPISERARKFEGYVGSALLHAIYQEFGTRSMAAQPYLRPAIAIEVIKIAPEIVMANLTEMSKALKKGQKTRVFK